MRSEPARRGRHRSTTTDLTGRRGDRAWPASALALVGSIAIFFGGLNTLVGNDLICIGYAALFAILAVHFEPATRFWGATRWPLVLLALAWGWAALGVSGIASPPPVAPDLAPSALLGVIGSTFALLAAAMVGAAEREPARTIDRLLAFGIPGLVLALMIQGSDEWPWTRWFDPVEGRFLGTLDNANAAAACYGVLATLALARALTLGASPWRPRAKASARLRGLAYPLVLLLALGGCLLTKSRTGAVLTFVAMAIVIGRAMFDGRRHLRAYAPALLGLGALLAIAGLVLWAQALDRFGRLPNELSIRLQLWDHNSGVAAARPLFGYGIGSFPAVNGPSLVSVRDADAMWTVNSPHNIVLRLLIDGGWPYLLLMLAAATAIMARIARSARRSAMTLDEIACLAALGILVGMAGTDIILEVPGLVAVAMTLLGLVWGRAIARGTDIRIARANLDPSAAETPRSPGPERQGEDLRPELAR